MAKENKNNVDLNQELIDVIYQNIIKVESSQHNAAIKEIAEKKGFKLNRSEIARYKEAVYEMFSDECGTSGYGQHMAALWSLYRKSDQVQDYKGAKSTMDTIINLKKHIDQVNEKRAQSRKLKHKPNGYKIINWEKIREQAAANISITEIIAYHGMARSTIYDRCIKDNGIELPEFIEQSKDYGKALLKEAMFRTALEGNVPQQIFLSKNMLGYKDKHDITTNDESINKPIIEVINTDMKNDVQEFIDFVSEEKQDETN